MRTNLKFSLVATVAIMSLSSNSAFGADSYHIMWDDSLSSIVYYKNSSTTPIQIGKWFNYRNTARISNQVYNEVVVGLGNNVIYGIYGGYDEHNNNPVSTNGNIVNFGSGIVGYGIFGGYSYSDTGGDANDNLVMFGNGILLMAISMADIR